MTLNMCPASYGMISCFQEVLLEDKILLDWLLYCHLGSEILTPVKAPSELSSNMIYDLDLPWGNFGSSCVKVLLAEAILELLEPIPGGRQAAL